MATNYETVKNWSEILKNWAQALGILAAGAWAIYMFCKTVAPTIEPRPSASASLKFYKATDELDRAQLRLEAMNDGTTTFDIEKLRIRAWEFNLEMHGEKLSYINLEKIQSTAPLYDETFKLDASSQQPFPTHFVQGMKRFRTFDWLGKTASCGNKYLLVVADFYNNNSDDVSFSAETWNQKCIKPPQPQQGNE